MQAWTKKLSNFNLRESKIVDADISESATIVQPVNIYGCKISKNVFIGPFVEIQKNVFIGSDSRIQSHSFICEFVTIGKGCFVGHGVMFINDKFSIGRPARGDSSLWKDTRIADNVYVGSNATILPVSICENVVIGAGSVVTKDIVKPGIYAGNPASFLKEI